MQTRAHQRFQRMYTHLPCKLPFVHTYTMSESQCIAAALMTLLMFRRSIAVIPCNCPPVTSCHCCLPWLPCSLFATTSHINLRCVSHPTPHQCTTA
jgi:hypothetical protein